MRVGTKELKNRLSEYLRRVRAGDSLEVTDRGRVVAVLRPPEKRDEDPEAGLAELEAMGLLTRGGGRLRDHRPKKPKRSVRLSEIVIQDRG